MRSRFEFRLPRPRPHHRSGTREHGQSLTEFTLIVPILLMLLLGIADFARLYNTMISVEAAAREAADAGTLYPWQWNPTGSPSNVETTVAGMKERACKAVSHLPEYLGPDDDCTNPSFEYQLDASPAGVAANQCHTVPRANTPCNVVVSLTYTFEMILPTGFVGVPPSITFERSATFAVADFEIDNQ